MQKILLSVLWRDLWRDLFGFCSPFFIGAPPGSRCHISHSKKNLFVMLFFAISQFAAAQGKVVETPPSVLDILPPSYSAERVEVDARKYPWSAIGRISLFDHPLRPGGRSSCTGTLISERIVLTAAHCVWSRRDFPDEVRFVAGVHRNNHVGYSKGRKIHLSQEYQDGEKALHKWGRDWALVEIERPIGKKAGYIGLAEFDENIFGSMVAEQATFKLSGYRGDRVFVQTVDHDCRIDGFAYNDQLIVHRCPLFGGDSGGPLLFSVQDELKIVGIDVGVLGKKDYFLRRGNNRIGFSVPSSNFLDKAREIGVNIEQIVKASEASN